jgi:diaminopimelate epimerase
MGAPKLDWADIPLRDPSPDTRQIHLSIGPADQPILSGPSAVNMGNPHAIFFVEAIEAYDLAHLGPILEHDPIFPEKANISLAQILSPDHIKLKVWERGVGLTQACGTAACAAAVAGARKGLTLRQSRVSLPGGDLFIDWRESDDHVIMTGPVELEFEGHFSPALFAGLPA